MNSDTIEAIRADLLAKKQQQAKLDAEVAELEAAMKVFLRYSKPTQIAEASPVKFNTSDEVIFAAAEIITTKGPLTTKDVFKELMESGFKISGADPEANLATILSRNKDEFGLVPDRKIGWRHKSKITELAVALADDDEI